MHIWRFAKDHELTIVTQDPDFADMAALYGPPPKVVWLRCGNQPNSTIESIIREHVSRILEFGSEIDSSSCLELF
jgi:predicted nuclease of predicted toxin-antitoxin system